MFDFYEKRKLRGIVFSRITAGILFACAIFLSVSAYGRYTAELETREKRMESARELDALTQRASLLEAKVERLESERGMEEEIREQFDVIKGNEKAVVIVEPANDRPSSSDVKIYPLPEKPTLLDRLKFW